MRTLILITLFTAIRLHAFEAIVRLPDGKPAKDAQISVVGRAGSVRIDADGRVRLVPDPPLPFTMIVVGPGGEIYPPIVVETASAGEITLQPYMETITVGVAPNIQSTPAAATTTLSRQDLDERAPQHLVDAIEAVPGVSRLEEGASGVPSIRGMARGRTLILIDHARVVAERRAGPSATYLDPFTLGSVEIARGPGTVAYGSDAFGGVIHARPREPVAGSPQLRYELLSAFGGVSQRFGGIEVTRDVGDGALLALFYARNAQNSEAPGGMEIDNSSFETVGGALRYVIGPFRVGLAVDGGEDVGKPASNSNVTRAFYPTESSTRLTFGYAGDGFDVRAAAGEYRLVLDRLTYATSRTERSDVSSYDAELRAVAHRVLGRGALQAGADLSSRFGLEAKVSFIDPASRTDSLAIEDAHKSDLGLFATYDLPAGERFTVTAGARVDRVANENVNGYFGSRSRENVAFSGHAAGTVRITNDLSATLQVARGFRDPVLSDRYFRGPSGRGFITGNPDLEPERSVQIDAALRWRFLALNAYRYQIDDVIERFRTGNDFFFRNRTGAIVRGLELEGTKALRPRLELQFGASYAEGEDEVSGTPVADIPADGGHIALRWTGERGFALARLAAFVRDDDPGSTEVARPGHATLDLSVGWRFARALELRVIGDNLTDRAYRESPDEAAAYAPGRSVSIAIAGRH